MGYLEVDRLLSTEQSSMAPSNDQLALLQTGCGAQFQRWLQQVGGRTLAGYQHLVAESGLPQVCWLHGNGFNSLAYAPLLQGLAGAGYPVFAADIPGQGLSHPPEQHWPNWRSMAATLDKAMAQQFAVQPACRRVAVGHSLGGILMLLQAHQNPERYERLLMLDPVLFSPSVIMAQQTLKTLGLWPRLPLPKSTLKRRFQWQTSELMRSQLGEKGFYRDWHPDALAGYVQGGHRSTGSGVELSCSPEWEARIFASYPQRLYQAIRQVRIPVHIICAADSFAFSRRSIQRAARLNSNISYQHWGDCHCFPMEQVPETLELIQNWLSQESG